MWHRPLHPQPSGRLCVCVCVIHIPTNTDISSQRQSSPMYSWLGSNLGGILATLLPNTQDTEREVWMSHVRDPTSCVALLLRARLPTRASRGLHTPQNPLSPTGGGTYLRDQSRYTQQPLTTTAHFSTAERKKHACAVGSTMAGMAQCRIQEGEVVLIRREKVYKAHKLFRGK